MGDFKLSILKNVNAKMNFLDTGRKLNVLILITFNLRPAFGVFGVILKTAFLGRSIFKT